VIEYAVPTARKIVRIVHDTGPALLPHAPTTQDQSSYSKSSSPILVRKEGNDNYGSHITFYKIIKEEKLLSSESKENIAYDFDQLFEKFRSESKLPVLFDSLIEILEKIGESNEIDSRKIVDSLNKLIATVKKNKNGSYFSTRCMLDLFTSVFRKFLWAELIKIPGLDSLLKALQETFQELDNEMANIHENMKTEMTKKFSSEFPFIGYDKKGNLIGNSFSSKDHRV